MMENSLVYTNDLCVGCNKCINACSCIGACISKESDGNVQPRIEVDGDKCVACGACFDACEHHVKRINIRLRIWSDKREPDL